MAVKDRNPFAIFETESNVGAIKSRVVILKFGWVADI